MCRSTGPERELTERAYDDVIVSGDFLGKIENADVVEDF